jgi:hypothetical protein
MKTAIVIGAGINFADAAFFPRKRHQADRARARGKGRGAIPAGPPALLSGASHELLLQQQIVRDGN